jgi:hypothetical protein
MSCTNEVLHIYCGEVIIGDDAAGFVTNHIVVANDFVFVHFVSSLGVNIDVEFAGDICGITNSERAHRDHFVNNKC